MKNREAFRMDDGHEMTLAEKNADKRAANLHIGLGVVGCIGGFLWGLYMTFLSGAVLDNSPEWRYTISMVLTLVMMFSPTGFWLVSTVWASLRFDDLKRSAASVTMKAGSWLLRIYGGVNLVNVVNLILPLRLGVRASPP